MSLSNLFTLIGGLSLFLYGMYLLGEGLAKTSGGKMEAILTKMTDNPVKGVLLGAGTTAVIQSSSATTVMVVGFVNSGLMRLEQAVGIIMGANIGTTVTSWLLSLSGLESDNFFLTLLKPETFSPVLALAGVILLMSGKSERKKSTGGILLGFSILMFGMNTMSAAVSPLKDIPEFAGLLTAFSNPVMGVLAGTVLTALTEFLRLGRHPSGILCHRRDPLFGGTADHHGPEYRDLYYRTALFHRCKSERKESRFYSLIF